MAERIAEINPACRVELIDDFLDPDNLADYLGVGYSAVIDAIDSVKTKDCADRLVPAQQGQS